MELVKVVEVVGAELQVEPRLYAQVLYALALGVGHDAAVVDEDADYLVRFFIMSIPRIRTVVIVVLGDPKTAFPWPC